MQPQHVVLGGEFSPISEAFQTHTSYIAFSAYQMPIQLRMIAPGYSTVNLTANIVRSGRFMTRSLIHRDRRLTCRTVSKALWLWPWWLSLQLVHSKKKNSLLWSLSQFHKSQFTPANSSKVYDLCSGRVVESVLSACGRMGARSLRSTGDVPC